MWIAGQTSGHGHSEPYGTFWDGNEKRMVLAHRWSAEHIHGFSIDGLHVDHSCPAGPSTLCVQHLKPETAQVNRELQHSRPGRAFQSLETRQYWVFVQKGIKQHYKPLRLVGDVPFFQPPEWLRPFMPAWEPANVDCPF